MGDRTNDAVRVDAKDLRCRAVAEGGNLGFTQRGRVEYALKGGKINTDAADNSAGVDTSDHEVNIKILLDAVVASGDMTGKQRNGLLFEVADEVASLVLRDNRDQNRALSLAAAQAGPMVEAHARYVRALEGAGRLDRALEFLPDEEALSERKATGVGLASPELAVLLVYAKTTLKGELLASDAPDDPYLSGELERYFPAPVRERFGDEMQGHRLRRELVATGLANEVVNRAGITFAFRVGEEAGAALSEVVRAYALSRDIFGARDLWARVEALDNRVPVRTQTEMFLEARGLIERGARWLLRSSQRSFPDVAEDVSFFSSTAAELAALLPDLLPALDSAALGQRADRLVAAGVPQELARRVAVSKQMFSALDIAEVAAATGEPAEAVAAVYFSLGDRLELGRLRERVEGLPGDERRKGLVRAALLDEFHDQQAALTVEVLRSTPGEPRARARLDAWTAANREPLDHALRMLADVEADDATFDLATLTVALREIHNLVHRGARLAPAPPGPAAR